MSGTLIVPLDGSQLSEAAVPWAACLARTHGLLLLLVRVTPWLNYPLGDGPGMYLSPSFYDDILAASHEAAQAELDAERQRLAEQGLTVETAVRDGPAADVILDLADEIGALAIVMATHGRGGLRRLLLGSVAERIIQQATR